MVSVPPFSAPSGQSTGPVNCASQSHSGARSPFASVLRRMETGQDSEPEQGFPAPDEADPDTHTTDCSSYTPDSVEEAPLDLPDGSLPGSGLQADPSLETQTDGFAASVGGTRPDSFANGAAVPVQGEGDSITLSAQSAMRGIDRQPLMQNILADTASAGGTRPAQTGQEALTAPGHYPRASMSEGGPVLDATAQHSQKTGAPQPSASIIPFTDRANVTARDGAKTSPRYTISPASPTEIMSAAGPDVARTTNKGPTVAISATTIPIVAPAQLPQSEMPIELGVGSMASSDVRPASGEPITIASPPPMARQIVQQVGMAITQTSNGTTEITLNPEELGRVRLTVSQAETGPTVVITAERQDVLDLMRRHVGSLGQDLAQAGLGHATFTFGGRDQQGGASPSARHPSVDEEQDFQPPASSSLPSGSGLDLRL